MKLYVEQVGDTIWQATGWGTGHTLRLLQGDTTVAVTTSLDIGPQKVATLIHSDEMPALRVVTE